ncbi:MAG: fused response regulator/phosphatase [Alphaproteobacteria bacterium]|nr:MAG: fused response regulator/phosphatase [Alphaproteobacteria bacterium]
MTGSIESILKSGDSRPDGPEHAIRRALVVDDSRGQRRILAASLRKWGIDAIEAEDGFEALDFLSRSSVDLIVSDWEMPGMSGVDFCRTFRDREGPEYTYFMLLTSKTSKGAIADGLQAGADDFLSKPFSPEELRARIHAGERILAMQREMTRKNALLSNALTRIRDLYAALDRDLVEAGKLQRSLVRDPVRKFPGGQIAMRLRPSGHVGGDLVGSFPVGEDVVGIFSIDVSGHGVTSAMMTARLASLLTAGDVSQNIAIRKGPGGAPEARPVDETVAAIDRLLQTEIASDIYVTMVLAVADLQTGEVTLCQAGHPPPLVQRADGSVQAVGDGGMPVGLVPGAFFESFGLVLHPGDRLLLYTDGATEAVDRSGAELGEDGLARMLEGARALRGLDLLSHLEAGVLGFAGSDTLADDLSLLVLEVGD